MSGRAQDARRTRTPARRAAAGFTLIEILLAMMIFLTGVAGLYALLSTGLAMQGEGLKQGRVNRRLDVVVSVLADDLLAGRHRDAASGAWLPVSGTLPDGTLWSATLRDPRAGRGSGLVLAEVRVAERPSELERADPLDVVLPAGLALLEPVDAAVERTPNH